MIDLDELERLDAAATPGPWEAVEQGGNHKGRVQVMEARAAEEVAVTYCGAWEGHGMDNARLIAALRNAAPALLAAAREGAEHREMLEEWMQLIAHTPEADLMAGLLALYNKTRAALAGEGGGNG